MSSTYRIRFRRIDAKGKRPAQFGLRVVRVNRKWDGQLQDLHTMLFGSVVLARAEANSEFREWLRKVMVARMTDPEDMALFPEFFPPSYRSIH